MNPVRAVSQKTGGAERYQVAQRAPQIARRIILSVGLTQKNTLRIHSERIHSKDTTQRSQSTMQRNPPCNPLRIQYYSLALTQNAT
jgi:hypothetical protein